MSQQPPNERQIYRLLLPGLFLLALGVGNVAVGTFKVNQYNQVLTELSRPELDLTLEFAGRSSLERIREAQENPDRLKLRQEAALSRIDFYHLVIFGGKVFVALSIPFLIIALIVRWRQNPFGNNSDSIRKVAR